MRIVQQCVFDDEDRRLLSIELPDDPCNNCYLAKTGGCCGCNDNTKYHEIIKPYKNKNILDFALKIKKLHELQNDIENIEGIIKQIAKELEEVGLCDYL